MWTAQPVPLRRSPARWWLVALALSVLLPYANSLHGPFFVDDFPTITEQARLVFSMHPPRDEALDARLLVADSLRGEQALEAAVVQYQAYVDGRPSDPRGVTGLAICLVGLNRFMDAAEWFTRAAELAPNDSAAQRNAAMALFEIDRVDAAAVYAERAA